MISVRSFSAITSGGSSGGSSSDKKETGSKDVVSDSDSDTDNEQAKDKEEPTTTPSAATLPTPLPAVPEGAHLVAEELDNTMNSPTSTSTTSSISTYDPFEIVKSFEDTSYYHPPSEEMETDYLAAKYQTFTNQDLLDSSTIVPIMDNDRPSTTNTNNNNSNNTWKTLIHSPPTRDLNLPKGTLVGTVVSTKMEKTVNVAINRYRIHPKYSKRMKYTRKFMAHDEKEVASLGDTVMIVPCQRISKMKHFMLREIVTAKGQL